MKTTITAAALALLALPASATTFDFAQLAKDAAGNGPEVAFDTAFSDGYNLDGLTVRATSNGETVWLDARSKRGSPAAGLGVCERTDCNGHWLDGIDSDDVLTLAFSSPVRMTGLFVRESSAAFEAGLALDHTPFSGTFLIDGHSFSVVEGITQGLDLHGSEFTFTADDLFASTGSGVSQYISAITVAPVPVPAAGLLLIGALGGMAAWRKHRKA